MVKKTIITIIVIIVVILVVVVIYDSVSSNQAANNVASSTATSTNGGAASQASGGNSSGGAGPVTVTNSTTTTSVTTGTPTSLTFNVNARNFSFSPSMITVHEGDTVTINFTVESGEHNFNIDAFNIKSNNLTAGQHQSITFVANKLGTFQFYCSFHKAMGMVGTLTVE